MEIIKESTHHLEEKIAFFRNEKNNITIALDTIEGQIEETNQQLSNIDLQLYDTKESMNSERNKLIGSLLGVGALVILVYLYSNIIFVIIPIILFAYAAMYFPNRFTPLKKQFDEQDQNRKDVYMKLEELLKAKNEHVRRLEYSAKKEQDYTKGLEGEQLVTQILNDCIAPGNYLINDITLDRTCGNIYHVLVSHHGIFVIETKSWEGAFYCNGDDWNSRWEGDFKSNDYPLESLNKRAKANAAKLRDLIASNLPKDAPNIWVNGIIVFTNPNVKLSINEASVDVLKVEDLCRYIKHQPAINFSSKELKSIAIWIKSEGTDVGPTCLS